MQTNSIQRPKRGWVEHTGPLPPMCLRGWNAEANGKIYAGIFEIAGAANTAGHFMLVYHRIGQPKPTVERLPSLQLALDRGCAVVNTGGIMAHARGPTDPEWYKRNVPDKVPWMFNKSQ